MICNSEIIDLPGERDGVAVVVFCGVRCDCDARSLDCRLAANGDTLVVARSDKSNLSPIVRSSSSSLAVSSSTGGSLMVAGVRRDFEGDISVATRSEYFGVNDTCLECAESDAEFGADVDGGGVIGASK